MTREEAIKNIKDILEEATSYEHAVCYVTNCDGQALTMAIADMEKQIPKKVLFGKNMMTKEFATYCPNCGRIFKSTNFYCWHCGQALDWSEEDE